MKDFSQIKKDFLRWLGNLLLSNLISLIFITLRIEKENFKDLNQFIKDKKNFVIAFWHGKMLLGWHVVRTNYSAALISKSQDGNLLAKLLNKWNFKVVRGSSNDGGREALFQLNSLASDKYIIALTPDGPKGPPYKMKAGAVVTAKKNQLPLFLVGIAYKRKFVFNKSWDNFEVPRIFGKAYAIASKPLWIDKDISRDDTSKFILECERELNKLQAIADKKFR